MENEYVLEPCDVDAEVRELLKDFKGNLFQKATIEVGMHWFTPQVYIDAAREVMGDIDVDPATTERVQKRIKAKVYHTDTKEKDAFKFHWYGRMMLCPPYKEGLIDKFFYKVIDEYKLGNLTEGIICTHMEDSGAIYFQDIFSFCNAFCLHRGHIKWWKGHYPEEVAMKKLGIEWHPGGYSKHYSCFLYFGPNKDKFIQTFLNFGVTYGK